MTIKFSDITGGGIPYGNNAGRPANPGIGKLYSNGEEKRLELYTSSGWQNIVSETPGVVSASGAYLESVGSATLEITGTNFSTGAVASVIGTNGTEINANSTTVNSIVSITATFSGLSSAYEPYDIKVTNTSNLFGILPDALYINNILSWTTPAGSLGTFGDNVSISVSAVATDDSTIVYSLASGSSLPNGLTLNSSTGLISGTLPDISTNTTYTFTINASDNSNPVVPRTFSITSNAAPTWITSSGLILSAAGSTSISTTISATDPTDTVVYSLASGSSLPTGISLNSSTGAITGTLPSVASDTTYNFTINASDGVNIVPRAFSINSGVLGTAAAYAATTAHQLYVANNSITNGLYWIKPDLASTAKQMYCYFTGATGWIVLGRSVGNSSTYSNAPGFYNDGNTPTSSVNGSISLFDWSNTYMNNTTKFRFFDPSVNSHVQWYCNNLTTIKAAPDTFSSNNDSFQIRFDSESGKTSGALYKNFRVNPAQGQSNVPNFIPDTGASSPYGLYGNTMYIEQQGESGYRGFLITNGSSYESSYSKAGLGRYAPTPFRFDGVLLLANPR